MARKQAAAARTPVNVAERNEEFLISEPVNVGGNTSDLRTKIKVNCEKGTFKISPEINTKHVNAASAEETEAMVMRLANQVRDAIAHATERRHFWLMENGSDDHSQLALCFGDGESEEDED